MVRKHLIYDFRQLAIDQITSLLFFFSPLKKMFRKKERKRNSILIIDTQSKLIGPIQLYYAIDMQTYQTRSDDDDDWQKKIDRSEIFIPKNYLFI